MPVSKPNLKLTLTQLATVLLLGACGGGGTTDASLDGSKVAANSSSVTTTVMDGLIQNALVCVDTNDDGVCQPTETQGRTNAAGQVTLTLSAAEKMSAKLVAEIGTNAIDADTGPVTTPYVLRTTAGRHEVISPLTEAAQTKLDMDPSKTFTAAEAEVKADLGLDVNITVTDNFIAKRSQGSDSEKAKYKAVGDKARTLVLTLQKAHEDLNKLNCTGTSSSASTGINTGTSTTSSQWNSHENENENENENEGDDNRNQAFDSERGHASNIVRKAVMKSASLPRSLAEDDDRVKRACSGTSFSQECDSALKTAVASSPALVSTCTGATTSTNPGTSTTWGASTSTASTATSTQGSTVSSTSASVSSTSKASTTTTATTPSTSLATNPALSGKALYAANSCGACHGTPPQTQKVLNGANNPARIASAISSNAGGMGMYAGKLSTQNLSDLAAYLASPRI